MSEFNHNKMIEEKVYIESSIDNHEMLENSRKEYIPIFLDYINSDKNKIIEGIKELKKLDVLFLLDPFSRIKPFPKEKDKIETIKKAFDDHGYVIRQGEINETITTYILLMYYKKLKIKELIPELVLFTYSIYEDIYKETKIDLTIIRNMADVVLQKIIRRIYYIYPMSKYNDLSSYGMSLIQKENEILSTINSYYQNIVENKTENPSLLESLQKEHDQVMESLMEYKKEIYDFILSSGYQDLLDNYIKKLGEKENDDSFKLAPLLNIGEIEKLDSIIPKNYIMPNNKMMNTLSNGALREGITELIISNHSRKEVVTTIALNYNDKNIEITNKDISFTPYDRAVHNAVISLFEAGNINFTRNQVYRCMNGLDDNEKVSPQALGAVTKSIDKTRFMYAKIDLKEEAKTYGFNKILMEDFILSAKKITVEAGGKDVMGYKFNYSEDSKPLLYEYAQVSKQILTIPNKLLNTKDLLRSTPEVTVLREYLIRRIEVMKKNNKNQSNKIKLSTLYNEIGQDDPTKQKAQKIRENIEKLLKSFEQDSYIKGHKFYKKNKTFEGVEIFYE